MNELDVVRVKNTVRAEEMVHGAEVEIKEGWEGSIVADADTSTPIVGPEPQYGWAAWDPVLTKKIITDNFEWFKRLTEDEKLIGSVFHSNRSRRGVGSGPTTR